MTEGQARIVTLDSLGQLQALLPHLQSNQAITCGVPLAGDTPLTTRAGAVLRTDAVARTNEAFAFLATPALFPIDVDVEGTQYASVGAVLDALERASPWLQHLHRIARPSSSSFVGTRGLRGVHVYFVVTSGTDIPALAKRLIADQWLAGQGFVKISKSGALLTRQLADGLIYQPSRLMFEAQPVCQAGVMREVPLDQMWIERAALVQPGRPVKYKSPEGWLHAPDLPVMREIEYRRVDTAIKAARNARRREAKRVAIDYQRSNVIALGYDAALGERYGLLATRALGESALPLDWEIAVKDVGRVKVADILAGLPNSLGHLCADPFDTWRPDLEPKHFGKAEIVMMGDQPGIWSHKLQQFFAFTDSPVANLANPLDIAAEKLCGLVEFPEPAKGRAAPFVNVKHGLQLLLTEMGAAPRYNVCTNAPELENIPAAGRLCDALSRIGCANVSPGPVTVALEELARELEYDPWREAILALPVWDTQPRLDTFFSDLCGAPPSEALTLTGQMLFAGLVMRQLRPGAQLPVVPVLIGEGGTGKSRFVAELAAALGAPVPAAVIFEEARDMSQKASVSIVAELAEMAGLGRRDMEEVKAWTTDTEDVYRIRHEKHPKAHPRRFALIGTANKHELNRDETGNRRLMPVYVLSRISPTWKFECLQVLAEAKARFSDEATYAQLAEDSQQAVLAHNAADMAEGVGTPINDLDDLLPPILRQQMRQSGKRRVPSAVIRAALDTHGVGRQHSAQKIAGWLLARGWRRGHDGYGMRYYEAPENFIDSDDTKPILAAVNPFTATGQGLMQ